MHEEAVWGHASVLLGPSSLASRLKDLPISSCCYSMRRILFGAIADAAVSLTLRELRRTHLCFGPRSSAFIFGRKRVCRVSSVVAISVAVVYGRNGVKEECDGFGVGDVSSLCSNKGMPDRIMN